MPYILNSKISSKWVGKLDVFSTSMNMFHLLPRSALLLFLLHEVQCQLSVVLSAFFAPAEAEKRLMGIIRKVWRLWTSLQSRLARSHWCPSWCLSMIGKDIYAEVPARPRARQGTSPRQAAAAWPNFTVLLTYNKLVDNHLLRIIKKKNGLIESKTAKWKLGGNSSVGPRDSRSIWITFNLILPMTGFGCPCIW